MLARLYIFVIISLALHPTVLGQHNVSFQISSSVCKGESLSIQNSSDPGISTKWDFCSTLEGTYTSTSNGTVVPSLAGMSVVEYNGAWYGFSVTRDGQLLRIEFGSQPTNTFSITSLVNAGGILTGADWIHIIYDGNKWYGLVTTASNKIVRISWTSLWSAPQVQNLNLENTGKFDNPTQIQIVNDANNYIAVVANTGSNKLSLINFGNSMENMPLGTDILQSPAFSGSNNMYGVTVSRVCTGWEIYTTVTDKVYKVDVGPILYNPISQSQIVDFSSDIPISIGSYNRMKSIVAGNDTYIYFTSYTQAYLSAAVWRQNATHAEFKDLRYLAVPDQLYSLEIYKYNNRYGMYLGSFNLGTLQNIQITPDCYSNYETSDAVTPKGIFFSAPGTYPVVLTTSFSDGSSCSSSQQVTVTADQAPDITFSTQNNCVQNDIIFFSSNSSGNLINYNWDFGDNIHSSAVNPVHQYVSSGNYTAELVISASNGCHNVFEKSIPVYNIPLAEFILPTITPICTNQNYLVSNASTFDPGSNPTWEWRLNGNLISTQKDLVTSFSSPSAQQISLKAFLPGCSNEVIKNIGTVLTGPFVSFIANDACQGSSINFTNNSTGADAGFSWNFGDGGTSSLASPSHSYTTPSNYNVALTAANTQGCLTTLTKPIRIFSLPQPDFSISLPPFSCANAATPFQNNTPQLTDSNIITWNWLFGDPAAGSANVKSPSYIYTGAGNYNVQLSATSDAGCSAAITKPIVISSSPNADFTFGPTCVNQVSKFKDVSSGGVQSRLWQINTATSTNANPTYNFTSSGTFPVVLTVTGSNGCSNVKSASVFVPPLPQSSFSTTNLCATQDAIFTDTSVTPADPVSGWNWNFAGNSMTWNPAKYNFPAFGTYNVKLTTTHLSGCQYTLSQSVFINATPVAAFSATPDKGAAPLTVQFTNNSTGASSYLWTFNDKVTATSTRVSPVYTFSSLGNYSAELRASNPQGCTDSKTMAISVLIPSLDLILSDISLITDPVTGKLKCQVTILNNSNVPVYAAEVALFLAEKAVVNENLQFSLSPGASITRALSFTFSPTQFDVGFLCAEILLEKDILQDNNKRCINLDHSTYFFVPYPNPTAGTLRIDWVDDADGKAVITIVDNQGRKVYQWETPSKAGLNQTVHDLSFLTAGLYYAVVETSRSRWSTPFMRQ